MELINMNFFNSNQLKWSLGINVANMILHHKKIIDFIHAENYTFDLIMVESFVQEYTITLGHKFNAPVINLVPAPLWPSITKWLHLPSTFSYIPDLCARITDKMSFMERIKNVISGIIQLYIENIVYLPEMKKIMHKHFTYKGWETRPSLEAMLKNVSLTLVNGYHVVGLTRPYLPGIIEVGGMHIKPPTKLPREIQSFMDSATKGIILFSLGTYINLTDIPKTVMYSFIGALGKLDQKIIVKWVPDEGIEKPENIMFVPWTPQQSILAHKNLKLFITHGGLHSIEEATYYAVPVLGVPFFADQFLNMKIIERKKCGILVKHDGITENLFSSAIKEILTNPMYKINMERLSYAFRDQPMTPLEKAVYWVEYVIKNRGAGYLKSNSLDLDDIQYFSLDTIFTLIISSIITVWLFYFTLKKLIIFIFKVKAFF
ncbi:UDP-glycosyltransferase UGT5-like isoform X2 [Daktulosphaira vitifoliae]|nr:UDP-glycosyltransferase UGT5-like isoform X2 [Daktulosphaira vitifoliae]XP_050523822.1 UDP-glycosyltransferase UGT5-like isoform X2 [Daktulosphaira vitifoliae]